MSARNFQRDRNRWVLRTAAPWLGFWLGLALSAEAQESQFLAFPGEYAASRPSFALSGPSLSGSRPYSSPYSYSRPPSNTSGWTPTYAPRATTSVVPSAASSYAPVSRTYGTAYDAGTFSSWRMGGGAYDGGLFSSRPIGGRRLTTEGSSRPGR